MQEEPRAKGCGGRQRVHGPEQALEVVRIAEAVSEGGFKEEFLNDVSPELAERIPPDLWNLHWTLMTERRKDIAVDLISGLKDNLAWFPRYQAYLREHRPRR